MSLDPYPGDDEILRRLAAKAGGTIDKKKTRPRAVMAIKSRPQAAHFKAAKDAEGRFTSMEGVIFGPARTKKNSTQLGIVQSPGYKKWCATVVDALCRDHLPAVAGAEPWGFPGTPLNLKAVFYVDSKGLHSDLVGLLQGFCDALENAGIVPDDKWFLGFDGSRKLTFDTINPRVEFWITPL